MTPAQFEALVTDAIFYACSVSNGHGFDCPFVYGWSSSPGVPTRVHILDRMSAAHLVHIAALIGLEVDRMDVVVTASVVIPNVESHFDYIVGWDVTNYSDDASL